MFVRSIFGLVSFLGCATAAVDAPPPAPVEPMTADAPAEDLAPASTPDAEQEAVRTQRRRLKKRKPRKTRRRIKRKRPTAPPREQPPADEPTRSPIPGPLDAGTQAQLLSAHNAARTHVGVQALTWSDEVAATARRWAGELAANGCGLQHNPEQPYGENLYWTTAPVDGAQATASWVSEAEDYDAENHSCAQGKICGHYTQVVWANSTKLGCGMATCGSTQVWVCNYDPPGNYHGQQPF